MNPRTTPTKNLAGFLHHHLLTLLLTTYALAAIAPGWGAWMKEVRPLGWLEGREATPAMPAWLLGLLLFHAGLRVHGGQVRRIARKPTVLVAGLASNLAIPVLYLLGLLPILKAWHNPSESGTLLIGLALVAAMPVAGSSTGWAQSTGGDMALSLGMVLGSTILSPLTTPLALRLLGRTAPTLFGDSLQSLASRDTGAFLTVWVLLPSLFGMALRWIVGDTRIKPLEERLKPIAPLVLILLCYMNASACLPQALGTPDWDYLLMTFACVVGLCVTTFFCGFVVARVVRADREQQAALMFGLGMSNNGTGQVFATVALASHPLVLLPIIAYNLSQHVAAGCVHALLRESPGDNMADRNAIAVG